MNPTFLRWLCGCLVVVGAVACKTPTKVKRRSVATKDILAEVQDVIITRSDLQQALQQMSPYMRSQYNSFARRRQLLMQLVEFEVLVLEARKQGLADTADVEHIRKRAMVKTLLNRVVQKVRPVSISDAQIRAHYKQHSSRWNKPLSAVRETIRARLLKQRRIAVSQAFLAKLRQRYPVTINKAVLASVRPLPPKPRRPEATVTRPASTRKAPVRRRVVPSPRPTLRAPVLRPSTSVPAPTLMVPAPSVPVTRPSTQPRTRPTSPQ